MENVTVTSAKMDSQDFTEIIPVVDKDNNKSKTEECTENIYDDICDFDLGKQIEEGNTRIKKLEEENQSLKQEIQSLKDAIIVQKKIETILTKNISSLFLTAKAEIARKDRQIADLTEQLDNMYFRRRGIGKPEDKFRSTGNNQTDIARNTALNVIVIDSPNYETAIKEENNKNIGKNSEVYEEEIQKSEGSGTIKNEKNMDNINLKEASKQTTEPLELRNFNKSLPDLRVTLKEKENSKRHDRKSRRENMDFEDDRILDYRSNDRRDSHRQDRRDRVAYDEDRFSGVQHWSEDSHRRDRFGDLDIKNRRNVYDERNRYLYDDRRRDRRNAYDEREWNRRYAYFENDRRNPYDERGRDRRRYEEQNMNYYDDERMRKYANENVERNQYDDVRRNNFSLDRPRYRRDDENMDAQPVDVRDNIDMPKHEEDPVAPDSQQIDRLQEMRGYRNEEYDIHNIADESSQRRPVERVRGRSRSRENYRRENGRRTKSVGPSRSYHQEVANHDKADEQKPDVKTYRTRTKSFDRDPLIHKCDSEEKKVSSTTNKETFVSAEDENHRKQKSSNESSILHSHHVTQTTVTPKNPNEFWTDKPYVDSSNNKVVEAAEVNIKQDRKKRETKKLKMLTKVENDYRKKIMSPLKNSMDDTLLTTWDSESVSLSSWTDTLSLNNLTAEKTVGKLTSSSASLEVETKDADAGDGKKISTRGCHGQVVTLFSKRQTQLLVKRNINEHYPVIEKQEVAQDLKAKMKCVTESSKPQRNEGDTKEEGKNNVIVQETNRLENTIVASKKAEKPEKNERKTVEESTNEIRNHEKSDNKLKCETTNAKNEVKTRHSKSETFDRDKSDKESSSKVNKLKCNQQNTEHLSPTNALANYRIPKKKAGPEATLQNISEDHTAANTETISAMENSISQAETSGQEKTPQRKKRRRIINMLDDLRRDVGYHLDERMDSEKNLTVPETVKTIDDEDAQKTKLNIQENEENKESGSKKAIIVLSDIRIINDGTEIVHHNGDLTRSKKLDNTEEGIKDIQDSRDAACPEKDKNNEKSTIRDTSKEKESRTEVNTNKEIKDKPAKRSKSKSTETKVREESDKLRASTAKHTKESTDKDKRGKNIKAGSVPNLNSNRKESNNEAMNTVTLDQKLISDKDKNDNKDRVAEVIEDVVKDKKSTKECDKQKELENKPTKRRKSKSVDTTMKEADVFRKKVDDGIESSSKIQTKIDNESKINSDQIKSGKRVKTRILPNLDTSNESENETSENCQVIDAKLSTNIVDSTNELATNKSICVNIEQKIIEPVDDMSNKKEAEKEDLHKPTKRRKSISTATSKKKENRDAADSHRVRTRSASENKKSADESKPVKKIKIDALEVLDLSHNERKEEKIEEQDVVVEKLSTNISSSVKKLANMNATSESIVKVEEKIMEGVDETLTPKGVKRKRTSESSTTVRNDVCIKDTEKPKRDKEVIDVKINTTEVSNKSAESNPQTETKKRITNLIPVKDSALYSFENILVKNQLPSFSERLSEKIIVQLTDDGEIPLLHLDENHFNNLPQEEISKNNDLLKLLDMSNIETATIKFNSTSGDSKHSVDSLKEFSFENFMNKASSTPVVCNSIQKVSDSTVKPVPYGGGTVVTCEQSSVTNSISSNLVVNNGASVQNLTNVNNSTNISMPRHGRRRRCRMLDTE